MSKIYKKAPEKAQFSDNLILESLDSKELEGILCYLELAPLDIGERLADAGEEMNHVYFPVSGIVSFVYTLENGSTAEIGLVGKEGFVGMPVLFGGETMPYDVVVQGKGEAYRMPVHRLKELFNSSVKFRNNLMLFCQIFITQVSQTTVCNRHHSIEQQLCRWLLLMSDRLGNVHMNMTQELIAIMLGVRREGVSEAAARLRNGDIIEYHRGLIRVLDRPRLEEICCECYSVVKRENERLFSRINTNLSSSNSIK